ncbi:MAG: hypothetical protein MMC33_008897 [Icmadophila ericetorum]|nr:hypothetical protein [Icmadophila ericetorum]
MALDLSSLLGLSQPGSIWRFIAILLAVLNLKNLPFSWHIRLIHSFLTHITSSRPRRPATLFQPVVYTSHTPLYETDYNLHKSNSTYFSDLDLSRSHLVSRFVKPGIGLFGIRERGLEEAPYEIPKNGGVFNVILAAVCCSFKREILPYRSFEVWTRVLAWDRKWLYVVSHFVEKGKVRTEWLDEQWWWMKPLRGKRRSVTEGKGAGKEPKIFASALSKYVFKQGRITIAPAKVLQFSGYLPPRPESHPAQPDSQGTNTPSSSEEGLSAVPHVLPSESTVLVPPMTHEDTEEVEARADVDASIEPLTGVKEGEKWTWEAIEEERIRGLRIAECMVKMEELHGEFKVDP